jgi:putative two-component system response regulator
MINEAAAGKVLVVDDERLSVDVLSRVLTRDGYEVISAPNGALALDAVGREHPDVVLMDVNMPGVGGLEACRQIKRHPATRLLPVILVTGLTATADRIAGIDAGADDFLSKPFAVDELRARVRSLRRMKRYIDELESAEALILSLALTIEARDPATKGHCDRLAHYAVSLGDALGVGADQLRALRLGGFLHDVGKIGVPDAVLLKPASLNAVELLQMQQHPIIGDALCGHLQSLRTVRPIVRHHHERPDGSGYPDGLRGDEIPLVASIVGVVDAYDALTTARPYKPAFTGEEACHELREEARRGWKHQTSVEAWIDLQRTADFAHSAEEPS